MNPKPPLSKHMPPVATLALLLTVALAGCGDTPNAAPDGGDTSDVATPTDAQSDLDAGLGPDSTVGADAAIQDAGTNPNGCNRITAEFDKGLTGSVGMPTWPPRLEGQDVGTSTLAFWKYGKQSVLTVTFDDSTQGQARYAVPALYRHGLVGTFFSNPGTERFLAEQATWDAAYTTHGQEIANHTYLHEGGMTEAEADSAVELASDYIKSHVYGLAPTTHKILAFNRAGGTNWFLDPSSEEWNMFIRAHYLFERKYSTGMPGGATSADMIHFVETAFGPGGNFETTGGSMHFHGVCDEESYPGCDNESVEFPANNAAVQKGELERFLDWLVDPNGFPARTLWLAGYAEYRKYMVVRSGTTVHLDSVTGSGDTAEIHLHLEFDMPAPQDVRPVQYTTAYGLTWGDNNEMGDPVLYRCEPITVFTKVPDSWPAARVILDTAESHVYRVHRGEVRYEAFSDSAVVIRRADENEVDIPYMGLSL